LFIKQANIWRGSRFDLINQTKIQVIKGSIEGLKVFNYFLIAGYSKTSAAHDVHISQESKRDARGAPARALRVFLLGLATRLLVFAAIFDLCEERLLMVSFEFYQNEYSLGKLIVIYKLP